MDALRLHLGCGLVHRPGWINIDRYALDAADIQADAILLPFPDRSVKAIEARQLIEHLGYVGALYGFYEWVRVLAPGGTLLIETPDQTATLRVATADGNGDPVLPWLFGTEQRGQDHRYLFTADELTRLATQAGFEGIVVENLAARSERPTLRLTACRSVDELTTRFAATLRRAFLTSAIVNPSDTPQYLAALEAICEQASELLRDSTAEALAQLVSLSARYSPHVTACILRALPDPSAWPAADLAQTRRLATDLEGERFPARLACRWRALPKLPGTADAAWALLEREISLYLTARLHPNEGLDDARAAFEAATVDLADSDLTVSFFCREALTDLARRLTAQGVRAFARNDPDGAAPAFEAALGYDPDLLWPRWNLARLHLRQGRRLDALAQYEALQSNLPAGLRPAFERELDAVTGRADSLEPFITPLADLSDLLEGSK
jgi:predicted SAM-dependent methyltransferase